jgi:Zn finger protein HypA/HybF involved in hydrogenase expression
MEYTVRCNKCETLIGDVVESISEATSETVIDFKAHTTTQIKSSETMIVFCPNCREELDITKNENRIGQLTLL